MVSRTATALSADTPAIAAAHFRAEADPYHRETRPDGYLNLGTAENRLVGDLIAERAGRLRRLDDADTRYAPLYGLPALRERVADLLSRTYRRRVGPEDLVIVSGASAALDVIASALCDPGDAIVVPAPYYGAFDTDLGGRSGARLLPAPLDPDDGFTLRTEPIARTLDAATRAGVTVRAIALANPGNPLGRVAPLGTLRELAELAAHFDVDLICDEVYAHSVFGPLPFTSLADPAVGPGWAHRTHTVWGFAKDFGLPGFKVGVLHTVDPQVRQAARALAYFAPVSTGTQVLLAQLLDDADWVATFLAENRRRLGESYAAAARVLAAQGIPHLPAEAGCSVWADLRDRLASRDFDSEHWLWQRLFDHGRVSVMPGRAFHAGEPGWFRICHSLDPELVAEGISRLGVLTSRSS